MRDVIDLTVSDSEAERPGENSNKRSRPNQTRSPSSRAGASSDIVVVEDQKQQQRPRAAGAAQSIGNDDFQIVSTTGDVWNADLPHMRENCGVHAFNKSPGTSNAKHCGNCFCYICDCNASECKSWGTGIARADHCNAHSGSLPSRQLRQQAKRKAAPSVNNQAGPSNAAAVAAAAAAAAAAASRPANRTPAAAAAAARIVDNILAGKSPEYGGKSPEYESEIEELPSQAESDRCNCPTCREEYDSDYGGFGYGAFGDDPFGLGRSYFRSSEEDEEDEIEREIARRTAMYGMPTSIAGHAGANKPMAPPDVCTLKARPDPSKLPGILELVRLKFPCEAKGNNTIASVAKKIAPHGFYYPTPNTPLKYARHSYGDRLDLSNIYKEDSPLKLLPLPVAPSPEMAIEYRIRPVVVHLADGSARPTLYGVRVAPTATMQELANAAMAMALPDGTDLSTYDVFPEVFASPMYRIAAETPQRNMSKIVDDEYQSTWFKPMNLHVIKMPANHKAGQTCFVVVSTGFPALNYANRSIVIPVSPAHTSGGKVGSTAVAKELVQALSTFRCTPGNAAETARLVEFAANGLHLGNSLTDSALYRNTRSDKRIFTRYKEGNFLKLRIVWSAQENTTMKAFSQEALEVQDKHASAEELEATEEILAALKERKVALKDASEHPTRVLREITSLSEQMEPRGPGQASVLPLQMRLSPTVLYKISLLPKAGKSREGFLEIRVYVYRNAGANHRTFFELYDLWEGGGRNFMRDCGVSPNPLQHTLRAALWEDAPFTTMHQRHMEWKAKDQKIQSRSISTFMNVMETGEMAPAQQPRGLTVPMRPYQLQTLAFMLDNERGEGGHRRHMWLPLKTVCGVRYYYSPILGRASLGVPEMPWGGFCCEEMGLGKTVEVLALCLANPSPALPSPPPTDSRGRMQTRATLVVCAVSLVGQWIEEARSKTGGSMSIHMYHGQGRIRDAKRLATEFDLVVTTYATLSNDYGAKSGASAGTSPLHKVKWHRLVLDESHTAKNPAVGHTKAAVALEADRRWLCTGTPINTDINDLFGQFAVLKLAPFNNKNFFQRHIKNSFGGNATSDYASSSEMLTILSSVLVRHTKQQVLGGEEVLKLPPKSEELVPVLLTAAEQAAYRASFQRSCQFFECYVARGVHSVSRHLLQIMSLLLPVRRICSGGRLSATDLRVSEPNFQDPDQGAAAVNRNAAVTKDSALVAPSDDECPICMDMYESPAMTSCNHWFCKECILGALAQVNARCPLCRNPQLPSHLRLGITSAEAAALEAEKAAKAAKEKEGDGDVEMVNADVAGPSSAPAAPSDGSLTSESKLRALLKKLREMRRADPSAKALIFSQFTATIEWLKVELMREGFGHRHISGSMPLKQRSKAIAAFQGDPPTTVFLLSMRAGAVGINLTAASHVFLMEPALNPAIEEQAIGRAWRMGQRREVKVVRFYVQGSVEERIMEVVKQRQHSSGSDGQSAEESYAAHMAQRRSTVRTQDMAGSIMADKQNLRLEELQVLFKPPVFPPPRVPEPPSEDEEDDLDEDVAMFDASALPYVPSSRAGQGASSKNRMRRSKAGIAALTAVGAGTETGATPAATLVAPFHVRAPQLEEQAVVDEEVVVIPAEQRELDPPPQQQMQQQEPEDGRAPVDSILDRIKRVAGAAATGMARRLTPGNMLPAGGKPDAGAAADGPGPSGLGPGRRTASESDGGAPSSEGSGGLLVVSEHLPRRTPAMDGAARPSRRVPKRNYAQIESRGLQD